VATPEDRPTHPATARLADPDFYAGTTGHGDPHDTFALLRDEAPMAWNPPTAASPGFWAVSDHAEVMAASTDPATWCSGRGVLLQDIGAEIPEIPGALLYIDPPDHTRYRKLIQPAFGASRMRTVDRQIRDRVEAVLEPIEAGQPLDMVAQLAVPYPLQVISDLIGIPDDDWPKFYAWSDAFIAAADGGAGQSDEIMELTTEATLYLLDTVADRRAHSRDDLVTDLTLMEIDGDRLGDDELMMFLIQLLVAGNETTRNLISGGLIALANQPDQWRRLVEDPQLIEPAIEELLRWTSPVISFVRTAVVDTELGGQRVAAGDAALLLYASANRDELEFGPTAGQLDISRHPNHHLAFGFGTHFCLGAMLARLEGRILLQELLARFTTLEPTGPVERVPSTVIAGVRSAQLVFS
jgi:cytochrome P450